MKNQELIDETTEAVREILTQHIEDFTTHYSMEIEIHHNSVLTYSVNVGGFKKMGTTGGK